MCGQEPGRDRRAGAHSGHGWEAVGGAGWVQRGAGGMGRDAAGVLARAGPRQVGDGRGSLTPQTSPCPGAKLVSPEPPEPWRRGNALPGQRGVALSAVPARRAARSPSTPDLGGNEAQPPGAKKAKSLNKPHDALLRGKDAVRG